MSKKKTKVNPFFRYLAFSMIVITIIMLALFKFIDILPGEYFVVFSILIGIITLGLSLLVNVRKGHKRRIVGTILSILYIILLVLAIVYELNTIGFLKKLGFKNYKTENYSLVVLNTSKYENINDLNDKSIGNLNFHTDGLLDIKEKIGKKIHAQFKEYDDIKILKDDLLSEKIDAMLIENSILSILLEDDAEFKDKYKVIYDMSVDVLIKDITNKVNIVKDPFNIYISGIDTYGSVASVSRSDVNMVISVNPSTHQILITSIPRDYYVTLYGKGEKDKLTHAGIYGIETSVKTVEELLDIKINYYVKVNFTSVVDLVEALNGVDVYSKYNFTTVDGYKFQKGINYVDGKKALAFVRERKAFLAGDRVRVENQAAMVDAIIKKGTSASIIIQYNELLNALKDSFITNLDMESITEFIKKQIDDNQSWNVSNVSLNGSDAYDYTYSYKGSKLYVMVPNEETIVNAKLKIESLMKGE